jgi:TPR repeat protein
MKMRVPAGFVWLIATVSPALAEPPGITWEWYNTAKLHQRQTFEGRGEARLIAHYFKLAAEKGNAAAAYKLGELYELGKGVAQDPMQAFEWYMRAAAKSDKHGQLKVGWCYQKGIAVEPNPAIAAIWYRQAAENDNVWGYHMLAFMHADGDGVTKDAALARRYFELSLPKTKDHWAKRKLALLIASDEPERAKALMREAAAAGNAQAAEDLKKLP